LLLALSGTALALRSFFTSRGRRLRQFLSAQPLAIAEAPDGTYTKVVGRVRLVHDQVLTSAFGHIRCALFLTELWDESTSPPSRVRRILKAADHFRLDDGNSSVRVPSASLAPLFTNLKEYPAPLDEPLLSDALKLVFSEKTRPPWWAKNLSVREFVLAEDQQIAVAGIVRTVPSAEPHSTDGTYRTVPTMKVLEPPIWSKLIACDAVSPRLKDIVLHL